MYMNPLPDLEYLKENFFVDASSLSGLGRRADRPLSHFSNETHYKRWRTKNSDLPCGYIGSNGYYHVKLNYIAYPIHRIIFAIHNDTSDLQDKQVDHIDGNPLNNSPSNLRLATNSQNQFNRKKNKKNSSGYKNISFLKRLNKYRCAMQVDKKDIYIGLFSTIEEAVVARDLRFKELAGEFYKID